jgi:hypothetical protein
MAPLEFALRLEDSNHLVDLGWASLPLTDDTLAAAEAFA